MPVKVPEERHEGELSDLFINFDEDCNINGFLYHTFRSTLAFHYDRHVPDALSIPYGFI